MKKGVKLEDGYAHFDQVVDAGGEGTNHWYHVIVKEGRNRLVRRLWEAHNVTISRLIRIRFGMLTLPREVRRGKWKELDHEEVMTFMQSLQTVNTTETHSTDKK
jgi:23S rRNA pseudouridine2605 synthase